CSLAGYANINIPDFQSVFPPDVNFNEEKSSVCRYCYSIPTSKMDEAFQSLGYFHEVYHFLASGYVFGMYGNQLPPV
ncbi:hypothetical protein ACK83Q_004992, partial [Salmonella enterica]